MLISPGGGDRRVHDLRAVDLPVEGDLQRAGAPEVEIAGDQGAEKGTGVTACADPMVRETSSWGMSIRHQFPACRSAGPRVGGSRCSRP